MTRDLHYAISHYLNGLPSQTIALQSSSNMQNWFALATNTLAANRWDYTNTAAPNFGQQFYRARLLP